MSDWLPDYNATMTREWDFDDVHMKLTLKGIGGVIVDLEGRPADRPWFATSIKWRQSPSDEDLKLISGAIRGDVVRAHDLCVELTRMYFDGVGA